MFYLPNQDSLLFKKIKELCSIILHDENTKITWGPFDNEFKHFHSYGLFEKCKIKNAINLQDHFSDWYNKPTNITHPVKESREKQTTWSLQDAIKIAFQQFLDKNETVNKWRCGLDYKLNTWKIKLFSKNHSNANEEKEKRTLMIKYAVADCTAVTKLYFMIYPSDSGIQTSYETPTPTTASTNMTLNINDLSDISEEEEPKILMPYFDKPPQTLIPKFNEQNYLTIETIEEEMNEFNVQEQQQAQEQTTITKLSKSEIQRKKNLKVNKTPIIIFIDLGIQHYHRETQDHNEHQSEESISNTEISNDQQQQTSNDIISSFKNDLKDIETRLCLGSLGGFIVNDNLIEWQNKLKQSIERNDLGELLIQLQQTVPDKYASKIFSIYENQFKI
ncbi:unnamed protein product [Rotaria sp. Silwood1]|nr:unnamed protein product [Rotaria sp. Silwood1]